MSHQSYTILICGLIVTVLLAALLIVLKRNPLPPTPEELAEEVAEEQRERAEDLAEAEQQAAQDHANRICGAFAPEGTVMTGCMGSSYNVTIRPGYPECPVCTRGVRSADSGDYYLNPMFERECREMILRDRFGALRSREGTGGGE